MSQDQLIEMSFAQIMIIPLLNPIYKREVLSNMYRPTPFFLSRVFVSALTFFMYPLSISLTVLWFLGLGEITLSFFVRWWVSMTLFAFAGSAMGLTLGALFPNGVEAISVNLML